MNQMHIHVDFYRLRYRLRKKTFQILLDLNRKKPQNKINGQVTCHGRDRTRVDEVSMCAWEARSHGNSAEHVHAECTTLSADGSSCSNIRRLTSAVSLLLVHISDHHTDTNRSFRGHFMRVGCLLVFFASA